MTETTSEKMDLNRTKSQSLYGANNLTALNQNDKTLEKNFLAWHYSQGVPNFLNDRFKQLANTISLFDIPTLFKNLPKPYRRLIQTKKTSGVSPSEVFDRLSFNLISRLIGASVRILFIFAGILGIALMAIINSLLLIIWVVIPFLSFTRYLNLKKNTFLEKDLSSQKLFLQKLTKTQLLKFLSIFFDKKFAESLAKTPLPETIGVRPYQKPREVIIILARKSPALINYLEKNNIKFKEFELLVNHIAHYLESPKITKVTPIGRMLSYGYTNTLDKFCSELTLKTLPPSSRKKIIFQIAKILTRPEANNVLLVGEPGVGRHTVLNSLASAIQKTQLPSLIGRRVMLLDSVAIFGTDQNPAAIKNNFEAVLSEAKEAGNIILAIDNIDQITTNSKETRIDLTEVLTMTLHDNSLPIIGITTLDAFNQYIRSNSTLLKLFEKIDIEEPSREEMLNILISKTLKAYQESGTKVTFPAIYEIINKTTQLIPYRKQPEKSIILFEDALSEAKAKKIKTVDISLVDKLIMWETKIPVGEITKSESEKLKNLENILHQRIVGQNEAITEIAKALRRARAEIKTGNRPIGSFLFLGPTGVGKTETAKALAELYFGTEDKMVRLDMSEYQDQDSLQRLIGNSQMRTSGQLAALISQQPYSLLLVDEFEKANHDVQNLFLQILDEGFLTNALGKKVSFSNVIIIATSNAAAEYIREQVAKGQASNLSSKLTDYVLKKGLFSPELINRFDGVIIYHPLTNQQAVAITKLMLENLKKQLKDIKNINLEITDQLAQRIVQVGFDPTFGARPIRRLISDKIEDGIAKMIISGEAKNGDTIPSTTLLKFVS